jgi:hypothetical protein
VTPFTVTAVVEVLGSTFSVEVFENLFGTVSCGLQIGGTYFTVRQYSVLYSTFGHGKKIIPYFSQIEFNVVMIFQSSSSMF